VSGTLLQDNGRHFHFVVVVMVVVIDLLPSDAPFADAHSGDDDEQED